MESVVRLTIKLYMYDTFIVLYILYIPTIHFFIGTKHDQNADSENPLNLDEEELERVMNLINKYILSYFVCTLSYNVSYILVYFNSMLHTGSASVSNWCIYC